MRRFICHALAPILLFLLVGAPLGADAGEWPVEQSPTEVGRRAAEFALHAHLIRLNPSRASCAHALLDFAAAVGDRRLTENVAAAYESVVAGVGGVEAPSVWSSLPFALYECLGTPEYRGLANVAASAVEATSPVDRSDVKKIRAENLFVYGRFYGQAYRATGDHDYADAGSSALETLAAALQQKGGLFYHAPGVPVFWGRGNGLAAAGLTDLLLRIPREHPRSHGRAGQGEWYKRLITNYRDQMKELLAWQEDGGAWKQVLDSPGAWIETSGTALFVYAMATGLREGWLPEESYREAVRRAWVALLSHVDAEGRLRQISSDVPPGPTAEAYLSAEPVAGTAEGQAALLLAAAAMHRLEGSPWNGWLAGGPRQLSGDYLKIVRDYADTMLERGRDTYGLEHSPLFSVMLDRRTLSLCSEEEQARLWEIRFDVKNFGYRNRDRVFKGSNPQHDEDLYQVLYALSKITGEPRYAREADRTLKWFFNRCQSPVTGLLAWGEHMGWDFKTETIIWKPTLHHGGILLESVTHEFARAWVLWEKSFALAPSACERFARGLWEHQIHDHKTGTFSRHAVFTEHRTFPESEFPRHGGFYIATWAEAYKRTKDPVFAKAIDTLIEHFERHRSPRSGIVPATSTGDIAWPFSNLALAIELGEGAEKVGGSLAAKMKACASRSDDVLVKLDHDLASGGKGFLNTVGYHTLEPTSDGGYSGRLNGREAWIAVNYMIRYRQTELEGYRKLVLDAALPYLTSEFILDLAVQPEAFGATLWLLLDAHELDAAAGYLARADHFARQAVELIFGDGCPLPKANTKYAHYEAVTGGDTLAMALLRLWVAQHRPGLDVSFQFSGR